MDKRTYIQHLYMFAEDREAVKLSGPETFCDKQEDTESFRNCQLSIYVHSVKQLPCLNPRHAVRLCSSVDRVYQHDNAYLCREASLSDSLKSTTIHYLRNIYYLLPTSKSHIHNKQKKNSLQYLYLTQNIPTPQH
jgi:hypothetical protein